MLRVSRFGTGERRSAKACLYMESPRGSRKC